LKKIEPKLLKRRMLLFLGAIVVPCLVLVALGVRMIVQEEQLRVQRAEEERQRRLDRVEQELLSRLERLKLDPAVTSYLRPPETVVLVCRVRDERLFLPWDVNPDAQNFREWIGSAPFAGLMQQAAHEEHVTGKLDTAVRFYRQALTSASQPAAQVYARLSLARALIKMDQREQGFAEYGRILDSPPDMVDEHGIPLALYAAPPLLDTGIRQKETLALVRECLDRSYKLPPAALYFLRDLAERLKAQVVGDEISNLIRDCEQAEALERDFSRILALSAQVPEPMWVAYGEPVWLIGVATQTGSTDPVAIVVNASKIFEDGNAFSYPVELAGREEGETLGEHFPGLRVVIPTVVENDGALRTAFFLTALGIVITMTLLAGYLLMRDVRRELRLAEMRSQFVSAVSHELKTPLTAIRVFAESMRMDEEMERPTQQEYLDIILQESGRLGKLVDNVLEFARVEHGGKDYRMEPVLLAEAVKAAARIMKYPLEQAGFRLELVLDHDLPPVVADRDAIEQAILNLLNNAIKYSGESREVALRLFREDSFVTIQVTDHGVGIPREEQKRIFERFYRVSSSENRHIAGAGLGLTLVEHIARAHGGSIRVESKAGEGSTFTLRLPLENTP
jgi:signal transduction histidine kinase/tetratricopeptide (TPR) repeat protein